MNTLCGIPVCVIIMLIVKLQRSYTISIIIMHTGMPPNDVHNSALLTTSTFNDI